ncbi:MAG: selenocysteine-specific translation elongation factor [Myxococcales bacterium]|nr:selenocysteine-specific translation elongation factor [Myxococcales bacterium]
MRHVVIGTAGHVDHGKTSLVHRLTGVMTDRLPEEQRRGITIELGFAPWPIDDELLVSIIDAPGHRKLVHHMIAGASGIDIVLLVVSADEGVMPQTREHIAACKLLGVRRAVIAITKIDRVDRELAELAAEEAKALLEERGIAATAVLCSAKTGEGIEDVTNAVRAAIDETGLGGDRKGRVRLSVDRVFTVHGSGTVVTGTLVEGDLREGAPLRVLRPDTQLEATARGLHVHGEMRERATAPTRLAINLGGVALEDVHRGDVVTDDSHASPTRVLDVWLQALEPLKRGAEANLFIGTASSVAKVQPVEKTDLLEEGGLCRLRLNTPIVALGGDRFVLRGARIDGPSGAVLGGGQVLDTHPPKRVRAAKRVALLEAVHEGDPITAMLALAREEAPRPIAGDALPSRFAIASEALVKAGKELEADGRLVKIGKNRWVTPEAVQMVETQALGLVEAHHKKAPLDPGIKLQTLREQLAEAAGPEVAEFVVTALIAGRNPRLIKDADSLRLPSFEGAAQDAAAARSLEEVKRALAEAGLHGLSENVVAGITDDPKVAKAVLAKVVRDNEAIKAGTLWFDKAAVDALERQIVEHIEAQGRLTIAEMKDITGLGRKQTIPLLEHFDRTKVTRRDGTGDRVKGIG